MAENQAGMGFAWKLILFLVVTAVGQTGVFIFRMWQAGAFEKKDESTAEATQQGDGSKSQGEVKPPPSTTGAYDPYTVDHQTVPNSKIVSAADFWVDKVQANFAADGEIMIPSERDIRLWLNYGDCNGTACNEVVRKIQENIVANVKLEGVAGDAVPKTKTLDANPYMKACVGEGCKDNAALLRRAIKKELGLPVVGVTPKEAVKAAEANASVPPLATTVTV
eukprot:jgi/Mesvir1/5604/Mv15622-RA.1